MLALVSLLGQLVRGEGDKAKANSLRSISRGARVFRSTAAAIAAQKTQYRRLKAASIENSGHGTTGLLDYGNVPTLLSEKLCHNLILEVDRHPAGLTMADDQRALLIGASEEFQSASITFT